MELICYLITGIFILAVIYCVYSFVTPINTYYNQDSKSDQSYWDEILKKY